MMEPISDAPDSPSVPLGPDHMDPVAFEHAHHLATLGAPVSVSSSIQQRGEQVMKGRILGDGPYKAQLKLKTQAKHRLDLARQSVDHEQIQLERLKADLTRAEIEYDKQKLLLKDMLRELTGY